MCCVVLKDAIQKKKFYLKFKKNEKKKDALQSKPERCCVNWSWRCFKSPRSSSPRAVRGTQRASQFASGTLSLFFPISAHLQGTCTPTGTFSITSSRPLLVALLAAACGHRWQHRQAAAQDAPEWVPPRSDGVARSISSTQVTWRLDKSWNPAVCSDACTHHARRRHVHIRAHAEN